MNPLLFFFYTAVSSLIFVDQLAKHVILQKLTLGESLPVLPDIFHLTLVHNRGIAFGLFGGFDQLLFVTITVSILVLAVIGHRLWRGSADPFLTLNRVAIALIFSGAVGNWLDRLRYGAVIDFLDFRIWPVFNVADTAISIGVGLYLIHFFKQPSA
ncbi:MAG: signal peptidase II [Candidatus Omnitrophica bacterium]|nr:signal peptidase II [Candidatus Omnitrophota bacterium]